MKSDILYREVIKRCPACDNVFLTNRSYCPDCKGNEDSFVRLEEPSEQTFNY
jgi:uncharacterized OB-fold protein